MKRSVPKPLFALSALLATLMSVSAQTPAATIEGRVVRSGTEQGVAGATITLTAGGDRSVTSGPDGSFVLRDVSAGSHALRIVREGFFGDHLYGIPQNRATVVVSVTPGNRVQNVKVELDPGATISGRVIGADGNPVVRARIQIFRVGYRGHRRSLNLIGSAETNDSGEYRAFWFAAGEYFVRAAAPSSPSSNPSRPATEYVPTYFPNAATSERAVPVRLAAGEQRTAADISLQKSPTFLISKARNDTRRADDRTRMSAVYTLLPKSEDVLPEIGSASSSLGEFNFRVVPGNYVLYARSTLTDLVEGRRASQDVYIARLEVNVSDRDVEIRDFDPRLGPTVRVQIIAEAGPPEGVGPLSARLRTYEDVPLDLNQSQRIDASTKTFTFSNVPAGIYVLDLPSFRGYVADVRERNQSVMQRGVLTVGSEPTEVQVAIAAGGGSVRGKVTQATKGKENPSVVLIPEFPYQSNLMLYQRRFAEDDGSFAIENVAPGSYRLYAFSRLLADAEKNRQFMQPHFESGRGIVVTEDGEIRIDIPVVSNSH